MSVSACLPRSASSAFASRQARDEQQVSLYFQNATAVTQGNSAYQEVTPNRTSPRTPRRKRGQAASAGQRTAASRSGCHLGHLAQAPRSSSADLTEARKTPLRQKLGAGSEKVTSGSTEAKQEKGIGLFLSAKLLVKQIDYFFFFPSQSCHHTISYSPINSLR